MKITAESKHLKEAISWAVKKYDPKTINFVTLTVKDGKASLSHLGDTTYFLSPVEGAVADEEEFSAELDARMMSKLSKVLGNDSSEASLTIEENNAVLSTPNGNFNIPLQEGSSSKIPEMINLFTAPARELIDAMSALSKVAAKPGDGANLASVSFNFNDDEDKKIELASTDSYVIGGQEIPISKLEGYDDFKEGLKKDTVLMSSGDADSISSVRDDTDELVVAKESGIGNKFGFIMPDGKIALFAPIDAMEFAYTPLKEKCKDTGRDNKIVVKANQLRKAITTVASLNTDDVGVNLTYEDGDLVVHDKMNNNRMYVEIEEHSGPEVEQLKKAFVYGVISKVFHPLNSDTMALYWSEGFDPFSVVSLTEDGKEMEDSFIIAIPLKR